MENFSKFLNKKVKALYLDNGETRVVKGILKEVNTTYIIVDTVMIGLGSSFISCILQENDYNG